jgi:hypothetical protein
MPELTRLQRIDKKNNFKILNRMIRLPKQQIKIFRRLAAAKDLKKAGIIIK